MSASAIICMFASFERSSLVKSPHECHIIGGNGAFTAELRDAISWKNM